jgi:hypothetical protein
VQSPTSRGRLRRPGNRLCVSAGADARVLIGDASIVPTPALNARFAPFPIGPRDRTCSGSGRASGPTRRPPRLARGGRTPSPPACRLLASNWVEAEALVDGGICVAPGQQQEFGLGARAVPLPHGSSHGLDAGDGAAAAARGQTGITSAPMGGVAPLISHQSPERCSARTRSAFSERSRGLVGAGDRPHDHRKVGDTSQAGGLGAVVAPTHKQTEHSPEGRG